MKALKTLLPAAALAAGLAISAQANAAVVISIGTSLGAGAITTQATGAVAPGQQVHAGGFSVGGYTITSIDGTYDVLPDILSGDSINLNGSGTGPLHIFVTIQGLDASTLLSPALISTFSTSSAPAGTTLATFYDTGNGLYTTGTTLKSVTVQGNSSSAWVTSVAPAAGPYSLTEEFTITGNGTFNGGADIANVPEPATWGLMILGFGGIGAMVRNRRRQGAALTA